MQTIRSSDGILIFMDPEWEKYRTPIEAPREIVEELYKTKKPVWWSNGTRIWLMLYRTELHEGQIITRLRPGSPMPTKGWLRK